MSAQILDTLLLQTTSFLLSQTSRLICWSGSSLYYSYVGYPLTQQEMLELRVKELEDQITLLNTQPFEICPLQITETSMTDDDQRFGNIEPDVGIPENLNDSITYTIEDGDDEYGVTTWD